MWNLVFWWRAGMPTNCAWYIFLHVKNYKYGDFMIHWGYICKLPEVHTVKIPCRVMSLVWLWTFCMIMNLLSSISDPLHPHINGSIYRELGIIRYQKTCDKLHIFHSKIFFLNFLIYTYIKSNLSTVPPWFVHQYLWQFGDCSTV
jgi:hypothetical protein